MFVTNLSLVFRIFILNDARISYSSPLGTVTWSPHLLLYASGSHQARASAKNHIWLVLIPDSGPRAVLVNTIRLTYVAGVVPELSSAQRPPTFYSHWSPCMFVIALPIRNTSNCEKEYIRRFTRLRGTMRTKKFLKIIYLLLFQSV